MKRSITRWTTALTTAAVLGLPAVAGAKTQQPSTPPQEQQPAPQPQPAQPPAQPKPTEPQPAQPPAQPQPTQPPAQPQPTEPQPSQPAAPPTTAPTTSSSASSAGENATPEEHLRQAREAFNDIKMASIPARDRAQFAELRRHLTALDKPAASGASEKSTSHRGSATASASANSWGTEVAAIDGIITKLAGSESAGAGSTATPSPTGTSGTNRGGAAASAAIDDATRAKLMEIRTHITAYAAAKSGASSPKTDASATPHETTSSTAPSGSATVADTPRAGNDVTPSATAAQSSPATPAASPAQTTSPAQSAPPAQGNAAGAQTDAAGAQQPGAAAATVDTEAAHRSLLAARDALNQLTQLPGAAQLSGESRTQVQQLITNFNELITNSTDWRASYAKVAASLSTLLGPDTTDAEAAGGTPTNAAGAAGTAGAVGTSGGATAQLDPAIRTKLVEMRTRLNEFQKASGGVAK